MTSGGSTEGKHAVLRFLCDIPDDNLMHKDIPDWLFDLTGDELFMIPPYGKDIHRITAVKFLSSITKRPSGHSANIFRMDSVSYVELGSLGHWESGM